MTTLPTQDAAPEVYVHREPSLLKKALPWLVVAALVLALGVLAFYLNRSMVGRQKSFTIYFVERGWVRFLLFLLAASGVRLGATGIALKDESDLAVLESGAEPAALKVSSMPDRPV